MNHPEREQWVPYIFGETSPETSRQLSAHLSSCEDCRQQVEAWQRSLRRLDAWKLPRVSKPAVRFAPALKWAAAAALVLLLGFSVGRLTAAKPDVQKLRAAIEPQMRQTLRQEFAQMLRDEVARSATATLAASTQQTDQAFSVLAKAVEEGRAEDNRAFFGALDKVQSKSFAHYMSLKKDLDTVAVNTEHQLVQLADSK
jgi:putative zinc finger protein